jgi:hypothetical protein
MVAAAFVFLSLLMIPGETSGESPQAIVRVECNGGYWGTITGDTTENIEWEGSNDFPVQGDIIYVILEKADEDNSELKVSIVVDGNVRISRSTTDPMGEVRLSYSLGAEGDPFDEEPNEGENDEDPGCFVCVSALTFILISGLLSLLLIARSRK